ncbi:hypothetical protein Y027_5882 [Burkholderia pseudomallei TSV5]|nr:hypothetical protein Y027_5882 [Burkholderia pseudomallei TSV5]KGX49075.1 hypothetical protein Y025_5732 [Burkholderia pseudomallei TSV32]
MSRHHLPKILTSIKKRARQRCSSPSIHGALRPDERLCIPKILTFREFSPCDESRKRSPQPDRCASALLPEFPHLSPEPHAAADGGPRKISPLSH